MMKSLQIFLSITFVLLCAPLAISQGMPLESALLQESIASLGSTAQEKGDAIRGALLFHSPGLGCSKCHSGNGKQDAIAPDLSRWEQKPSNEHLVESILRPSEKISDRYRATQILTIDGQTIVGIEINSDADQLTIQTGPGKSEIKSLRKDDIEAKRLMDVSIMPSGQVNILKSRQEFLDVVRYLIEIREGGSEVAAKLKPTAEMMLATLPSYESKVDHAGFIADWNKQSFKRGEAIYQRVCQNCHGTIEQPGSLPTSLRFGEGKFKYGHDPFSMYQTLTHGGGMMLPQTWMVPQQKYDVIHYIREHFLKSNNSEHYSETSQSYLADLPLGDTRGPEPQVIEPWVTMDYGPMLITTIQFGPEPDSIAQKAIAIRVNEGPGGIARGNAWIAFEHDTLRMAAAWTGDFVDWNGIQFNGRHGVHLRANGNVLAANPNAPGWAEPTSGSYSNQDRVQGRDGRSYGPLPSDWGKFRGIYRHENRVLLDYTVGRASILEYPNFLPLEESPAFVRTLRVAQRDHSLEMVILTLNDQDQVEHHSDGINGDRMSIRRSPDKLISVTSSGFRPQVQLLRRDNQIVARFPSGNQTIQGSFVITDAAWNAKTKETLQRGLAELPGNLRDWCKGGPQQYSTKVEVTAKRWFDSEAWEVEELARPENNPWLARTRMTGMDFSPSGNSLVACTWDGDVWKVDGLDQLGSEGCKLAWTRVATGLFQPLGILWENDRYLVTCRDQLVALRDLNEDGEIDHYECFNSDHQVTEHFHEFAMGLQRNDNGDYFYAKSARHALKAVVPHHGTLLRVSSNGDTTEILATGFRAANGVCLNDDGSFIVTDQEGHWNPKNRINWVRPGGFYGNMYGYHEVTDDSDQAMQPPLCWITNSFDRSPAELLWAKTDRWGPLNGKLLNLSYGYGRIYVVPHEFISDGAQPQGGMCALPIPDLPTGMIRGRFSPLDGQLYVGGMFSWASSRQEEEGGLFRVRYRGGEINLPTEIKAYQNAIEITFSDPLDQSSVEEVSNYKLKTWDLLRSKNYGSPHLNERTLAAENSTLLDDQRTVRITIPDLAPTRGMEIICQLKDKSGTSFQRVIHNTIYAFTDKKSE
ncbi:c-type cytochrome [Rubripirellula sp.]|nr:DUF6797 domain-containing protein [Rubripirellula sp.]MDB4338799.1 c-type cytochrome [Rubripirellula sp.]